MIDLSVSPPARRSHPGLSSHHGILGSWVQAPSQYEHVQKPLAPPMHPGGDWELPLGNNEQIR
jgi:hypothetical protein